MDELPDLKKVKISCTAKDCDNDLHLFRPKRGGWKELKDDASCQGCDATVDMTVTRARDLAHPEAIFAELGREFVRYVYLNRPIDARARRLIRRDGIAGLRGKVRGRIETAIGGEPNAFDGRQTPLEGNVLHYAQHATATCCRRCAWYWYGIPLDGKMAEDSIAFCAGLLQAYLDRREGEILAIAGSPPDDDDHD